MKRVALIQSNYIPWKGYFDIINDVDLFVFHDDLQYTKGDWRNRNIIKTATGERWLTIPVGTDERRRICDVALPNTMWARDHWRRLEEAYGKARYFGMFKEYFAEIYLCRSWLTLSEFNQAMIRGIARDWLGIRTRFADSREFNLTSVKGERVIELLQKTEADLYVSGPAARNYLTDAQLAAAGINVEWKDYGGYPEYAQVHPPFAHGVTVLDLLFHAGPEAAWHIWGWRASRQSAVA